MPQTKHAIIRYNRLDKCFRNRGKEYSFKDLLDEVNRALSDFDPDTTGIQTRQLRDDIAFMRRADGYDAPIETYRIGRKGYYRYSDPEFSINKSPLNATEAEQLKAAIAVMQRFDGAPGFEWMQDMGPMLSSHFGLQEEGSQVIGYDSNIDYLGYEHITPLFNAIVNRQVLEIEYEPFDGSRFSMVFHPHYLKQFNNRWFCFGYNQEKEMERWNLALDRIMEIRKVDGDYWSSDEDWEDFFSDMVGVTHRGGRLSKIRLRFTPEQAPYVRTKPMHPSQKMKDLEDGALEVELKLIPNFELESLILSFGERVEVLAPESLRKRIRTRLKRAVDRY